MLSSGKGSTEGATVELEGSAGLVKEMPKVLTNLPDRYTWYPNPRIESPMKLLKCGSITPPPKSISSYARHKGKSVRKDPTTPQSCMASQATGTQVNALVQKDLAFGQVSSAVKTTAMTKERSWRKEPLKKHGFEATPKVGGNKMSMMDNEMTFDF